MDTPTELPVSGNYFCFDFGQKRIGLAVGHSETKSASPLCVIRNINGRPEWHQIDDQVGQWKPVGLVVGLPMQDDPQQNTGNQQQLTLSAAFSKKLRNRYKLPVYRCDERFTSIEAARVLAENRSRGNRKKVARNDLDMVAAAIILDQWFNNDFQ